MSSDNSPQDRDYDRRNTGGVDNKFIIAVAGGVLFGAVATYAYLSATYRFVAPDKYDSLVRGILPVAEGNVAPTSRLPPLATSGPQSDSPRGDRDRGDRDRDGGREGRNTDERGGSERNLPAPTGEYIGEVEKFDLTGSPTKGPEGAKITLIEYSDFECPACVHWAPDVIDLYKERSDKMRIVFKHVYLPDHKDARGAAHASEAAKLQGKFWEYADVLFKNGTSLGREDLIRYAGQLSLDVAKFKRDMDSAEVSALVSRDQKEGERAIAQSKRPGVPAFFVNNRRADVNSPQQLAILLDDVK